MKSLLILPLTILLIVGCGEKKAKLKFGDQVWFGIRTGSGHEVIRGEGSPLFWYISETENVFKLREGRWSPNVGESGGWFGSDETISKRNINWLTRTDVQKPMPSMFMQK